MITTFQTLASEHAARLKGQKLDELESDSVSDDVGRKVVRKGKSAGHALFDVKWLRVVIGEHDVPSVADSRRSAEHQESQDQSGRGGTSSRCEISLVFDGVGRR